MTFPAQVVAAKQLEESKTKSKTSGLVGKCRQRLRVGQRWSRNRSLSRTGRPQEGDSKSMMGEEDEFNGNLLTRMSTGMSAPPRRT